MHFMTSLKTLFVMHVTAAALADCYCVCHNVDNKRHAYR